MDRVKYAALLAFAVVSLATAAIAAPASSKNAQKTAVSPVYGVVDVQKIFTDSKPAKAASDHMEAVRKVLQKGMDDVIALNKGKEETPEGRAAIAQAQQVLNRQMAVEQQATNNVMEQTLRQAVDAWMKRNSRTVLVVSKQLTLGNSASSDVTPGVLNEMNRLTPKFPDLPKVTINQPEPKNGAAQTPAAIPAPAK